MATTIIKQIQDSNGDVHDIIDTKNTAGAENKLDTKMYLIATEGDSGTPVTNTNANIFIDTNNALHATAFYQDSDERLKTFTEEYNINLDDIKNIKTGRFYWNSDEIKVINGGVSAQSVEKYFPELVREDESGTKSVNYDGLAGVALAAIKKLTERIEELEEIVRNK